MKKEKKKKFNVKKFVIFIVFLIFLIIGLLFLVRARVRNIIIVNNN